jgi:hypothetical protein
VIGEAREIGERVGIRLDIVNKLCQSVSNPADEIAEVFLDEVLGMVEAYRTRGFDATVLHNSLSNKEKQIWVIRGKKTKAKGNNRKRPSLIQRKNEN